MNAIFAAVELLDHANNNLIILSKSQPRGHIRAAEILQHHAPHAVAFVFEEESLDFSAGGLAKREARGDYLRIVEDQQIARAKKIRQVRELTIFDRTIE